MVGIPDNLIDEAGICSGHNFGEGLRIWGLHHSFITAFRNPINIETHLI